MWSKYFYFWFKLHAYKFPINQRELWNYKTMAAALEDGSYKNYSLEQ